MNENRATSTEELLQSVNDVEVKRKLALGRYYDLLNLTYQQEKDLKDELLLAKRFENDIYERVTSKIESGELDKVLKMYNGSKAEKLTRLQSLSSKRLKQIEREEEENELRKLNEAQAYLIKSEEQKLVHARYMFEQAERKRAAEEEKEFEERNAWRNRVPDVQESLSPQKAIKPDLLSDFEKSEGKVLLIMSVDIGNGEQDTITVHDNDSFLELSTDFVEKHRLPQNVIEPLAKHIRDNAEPVMQEPKEVSPVKKTPTKLKPDPRTPSKDSIRTPTKKPKSTPKIASTNFYQQHYFHK